MMANHSLRIAFLAAALAMSFVAACDGNHDAPIMGGPRGSGGSPPTDTTDASDQDETVDLDSAAGEGGDVETGSDVDATVLADVSVEAAREASPPSDAPKILPPDPTVPLAAASPSCLDCAVAGCQMFIQGCAQISGSATAGPAKGTSRAALCVDTLSCVLSTGCATCDDPTSDCTSLARFGDCYCRFDDPNAALVPDYCYPPGPTFAGPCKSVLERSLETTDAKALLAGYSNMSVGGGWAMQLMQCLVDNGCTTCFPSPRDGAADDSSDGGGTD